VRPGTEGREPRRCREAGPAGTAHCMWLKSRANWTENESQKWESMALERCVTGMAYEMRLVLQGIYERKDAGEARKLFGVPGCMRCGN
jgi:hypothetical protein